MTWIRFDDSFPDHPKIGRVGGDAAWLFVCGIAYCNRNLTDGVILAGQVARLSDRRNPAALARKLLDAGLWDEHKDGYMVHDYLTYQPSKAQVLAEREKARLRMQSNRKSGEVRPNSDGTSDEVRMPRPDPTRNDELKTDDISKSVPEQPPSSSPSFAQRVTTLAAQIVYQRTPMNSRIENPPAFRAAVAKAMLTEREDRIREAHARGLSDEAAAEYIVTEPLRLEVDPRAALQSARTYGATVKHMHLTGDDADLVAINREAFLSELAYRDESAEWHNAAVHAYDEYRLPPDLRVVG